MSEAGVNSKAAKAPAAVVRRAPEPAAPAPAGPMGQQPSAQAAAGNLAVQSLMRGGGQRPGLAIGRPDDPEEREAEHIAEVFTPRGSGGATSTATGIPPALLAHYENFFAAPLGDVRFRRDAEAQAAAAALGARAFTHGTDVHFGAHAPGLDSVEGQRLLAHELAHVMQGGGALRRAPDPNAGAKSADDSPGGASKVDPPPTPDDVAITVEVGSADLGAGKDEKQKIVLHSKPDGEPLRLQYYAIPIAKLRKLDVAPMVQPPPPAAGKGTLPPSDAAHPAGTNVTTLDGKTLQVLASTPEHVIVAEYHKYAVGAASTSALKLSDGSIIVIDAGVNSKNMGMSTDALSKLTLSKLEAFIGDKPIREFLLSHVHEDHVSLAPEILKRFPVDTIRLNSVMSRWPKYKELRAEMVKAQNERLAKVKEAYKQSRAGERAAWESKQPSLTEEAARNARWDQFLEKEFAANADKIPGARGASERILVQAKRNVLDVADVDMATGQKRGTTPLDGDSKSTAFGVDDPFNIRETQAEIKSAAVRDQRRNTKDSDIDKNASTYVVSVKGGARFLVLPDLRANDLKRLSDRFAQAVKGLKGEPTMQVWDASHHMQKGWYAGKVPASQMAKIVDFLFAYKNKKGSDIVVVSAEADLSNPNAKTLVDPANLWILRSLGFEAYLATSGQDVRVMSFKTSEGKELTGVAATRAPGKGPPSVTLARAKAALEKISADRAAQQAMLKDETDANRKLEIQNKITELGKLYGEINTAYKECLAEIPKKFQAPDGGHTTQSLTDAGQGDFPKQKVLDQLLEKHKFDLPVTSDAHLTPMALVILGQHAPGAQPVPDNTPEGRARKLARVRSEVLEISARVKKGAAGLEVQAELLGKLLEYRSIVNAELNPADPAHKPLEGVTKELLIDDLKGIDSKIEALQEAKSAKTFKRVGGDVIEQHVVSIKAPPKELSAVGKATKAGLEGANRVMGGVMVITTVTGEGDLLRRWNQGSANKSEVAVGTVRNAISGAVALKMLRGVPVSNTAFVVLAALEITEAWLHDYESREQKNTEVAFTAVSAAVNLGLMAIGGAMMTQLEAPPVAVAGLLLTMAGPKILEALHIHDLLEQAFEFDPASVTEVKQELRDLMVSYKTIVGSIELAERSKSKSDRSVTDAKAVNQQADKTIEESRSKAIDLEIEIMDSFKEAYAEARTAQSGLRALDEFRAQFLAMRLKAGTENYKKETPIWGMPDMVAFGPTSYTTQLSRTDVEERFKKMDQELSMAGASVSEIEKMKQWVDLKSGLAELRNLVDKSSKTEDSYKEIREQDGRVTRMVENARYRLDPGKQSDQRTVALLPAGSAARTAYENLLNGFERTYTEIRRDYLTTTQSLGFTGLSANPTASGATSPTLGAEETVSIAEGSVRLFKSAVEKAAAPPKEMVTAMFSVAHEGAKYRDYMKANPAYALELQRLESAEGMVHGLVMQAKRAVPAAGTAAADKALLDRVTSLSGDLKEATSMRYHQRGLVYASELGALGDEVQQEEIGKVAKALGDDTKALSPEELAALQSGDYGDPGEKVTPPLRTRLLKVPHLSKVNANGDMESVFRLVGKGVLKVQMTGVRPYDVTADKNALVGVMGPAPADRGPRGEITLRVAVMPLNDAAISVMGEYRHDFNVEKEDLMPVKAKEFLRDEQPKQP